MVIPSGIIEVGEKFHVCIKDADNDVTLECYVLHAPGDSANPNPDLRDSMLE